MKQENSLKREILKVYKYESHCADAMGWTRQKLNKITNGDKEPTVEELNAIAKAIHKPISYVISFFLPAESPNRQQAVSD